MGKGVGNAVEGRIREIKGKWKKRKINREGKDLRKFREKNSDNSQGKRRWHKGGM